MGANGSQPQKINKALQSKLQASVGLNERALQILYNRFIYLYLKTIPIEQQAQIGQDLQKGGIERVQIPINIIKILKEFQFHPFIDRILEIFKEQMKSEQVDLESFLVFMSNFSIQASTDVKKKFLFRIYDRENRNGIPANELKNILTNQLFPRTHYSEVSPNVQAKSSYSDKVMRTVIEEAMAKYDKNKDNVIDFQEFLAIVTDADVDQIFPWEEQLSSTFDNGRDFTQGFYEGFYQRDFNLSSQCFGAETVKGITYIAHFISDYNIWSVAQAMVSAYRIYSLTIENCQVESMIFDVTAFCFVHDCAYWSIGTNIEKNLYKILDAGSALVKAFGSTDDSRYVKMGEAISTMLINSMGAKAQVCEVDYICQEHSVNTGQESGNNEPNNGIFVQNKIKKQKNHVEKFVHEAAKNPKIFNIIKKEAIKRGYLKSELSMMKQQINYYDQNIKPYQSIDNLPKIERTRQIYNEFIDEKDMHQYQKEQRVRDYMKKLDDDDNKDKNEQDPYATVFMSSMGYLEREQEEADRLSQSVMDIQNNYDDKNKNKKDWISLSVSKAQRSKFNSSLMSPSSQQMMKRHLSRKVSIDPEFQSRNQETSLPRIGKSNGAYQDIKNKERFKQSPIKKQFTTSTNNTLNIHVTDQRPRKDSSQQRKVSHQQTQDDHDGRSLKKYAIQVDRQCKQLQNHFRNFSNIEKKLDQKKIKKLLQTEYEIFGVPLYKRLKKVFINLGFGIDFTLFSDGVERLLNLSSDSLKKMYFNLLDLNHDGKLCESDLFKVMQLQDNEKMMSLLNDDLCTILKEIEKKRQKNGKSDSLRFSISNLKKNIYQAKLTMQVIKKPDYVENAKNFFSQVRQQQVLAQDGDSDPENFDQQDELKKDEHTAKRLMKQDINMNMFSEYLMEKVDKEREFLSVDEFCKIEFQTQGLPKLIVDSISRVTSQEFESILRKRSNPLLQQKEMASIKNGQANLNQSPTKNPRFANDQVDLYYLKFDNTQIDYEKQEAIFRDLAMNPECLHDYDLKMNYKSLEQGIVKLYGGRPNSYLAQLILFQFTRGKENSEVSYYQYLSEFVQELITDANHMVFNILDENRDCTLQVIEIVRFYVNIPPNSKFSYELRTLFKYYIKYNLMPSSQFKRKIEFNYETFKQLIPKSSLAIELQQKFLGSHSERQKTQSSFFEMPQEDLQQQEKVYDEEIRKYMFLFGAKINEKNLDDICAKFINN